MSEFVGFLDEVLPIIDQELASALDRSSLSQGPEKLSEAVRYAVMSPGKRVRPAFVLLTCEAAGGERSRALAAAVAVEMIHAYSLVHDDLPCMDDDRLRRGRPTVHIAYDEAMAVLVGDALQALAFETLAAQPDEGLAARQAATLARAAGPDGMVGGQVLDMEAEGSAVCSDELVAAIHRRKTGALLVASFELGALSAGVDPAEWRPFASACGSLFQAVDDLLDATSSTAMLGKTAGKDLAVAKASLPRALGEQGAATYCRELAAEADRALGNLAVVARADALAAVPRFLLERIK